MSGPTNYIYIFCVITGLLIFGKHNNYQLSNDFCIFGCDRIIYKN